MDYNFYAKEFFTEVRDKKRIGNGIHGRKATRKGSVGALRTPYNMASTKEKRKMTRSEMTMYNVNKICDYREFKTYDTEKQRFLLEKWRESHTNSEIAEGMNTTSPTISYLVKQLGLARKITRQKNQTTIDESKMLEDIKNENPPSLDDIMKGNRGSRMIRLYELSNKYTINVLAQYWDVTNKEVSKILHRILGKKEERKEKLVSVVGNDIDISQLEEDNNVQENVVETDNLENEVTEQSEPQPAHKEIEVKPVEVKQVAVPVVKETVSAKVEEVKPVEIVEPKDFLMNLQMIVTKDNVESVMLGLAKVCVENREYKLKITIE